MENASGLCKSSCFTGVFTGIELRLPTTLPPVSSGLFGCRLPTQARIIVFRFPLPFSNGGGFYNSIRPSIARMRQNPKYAFYYPHNLLKILAYYWSKGEMRFVIEENA